MANLVHTVYFALNDHSQESTENFLQLIQKWLPNHPGEQAFILGPRNQSIQRDVSDLLYDIAMTIVFDTAENYAAYDASDRHTEFRNALKTIPCSVRVFDSFTN